MIKKAEGELTSARSAVTRKETAIKKQFISFKSARDALGDKANSNLVVKGICTAGAGHIAEINEKMKFLTKWTEVATRLLKAVTIKYPQHKEAVDKKLESLSNAYTDYSEKVLALETEGIIAFNIESDASTTSGSEAS